MISIERAKPEDKESLYALFAHWDMDYVFEYEAFCESFDRVLANAENRVVIARCEGRPVGYAQFFPCDELGFCRFYEIAELLVAGDARSRGIGQAILDHIEAVARENGVAEIKLSSQTYRNRAHAFYERAGYSNFKTSKFYSKTL